MKVKIGKYKNWFGPFQLAETLCFWVSKQKDEYGFSKSADWVYKFGELLAYGSIKPESKVDELEKLIGDRPKTFIYKFLEWIDSKKSRNIKIHIDPWDTWNMNDTLALIIAPMLKQLKETKNGAPNVDDEDVPENLRRTAAPAVENDYDIDENFFKRWDWVLDEMIFAFDCLSDTENDWEDQFYSGECDFRFKRLENGMSQLVDGPTHTYKCDHEGLKKFNDRIENGCRLFGKYYRTLWD